VWSVNDKPTIPHPLLKGGPTLRTIGAIVFVLGISSAGALLWIGKERSADSSGSQAISTTEGDWKDGSLSLEDSKRASRDLEMYNGKVGMLTVKFYQVLQRPETPAIIIATISALIASGCFFFAQQPRTQSPPELKGQERFGAGPTWPK
jgi:hypothetical protein